MKKFISILLIIVLMCTMFVGCSQKTNEAQPTNEEQQNNEPTDEENKYGGTLVSALAGDLLTFNPATALDDNMLSVAKNVFNKLVQVDYNNNVIPDLAHDWKISEDGLEYVFYLTEGVKFHDGEELTAEDVKWTYDQVIENKSPMVASFTGLKEIIAEDEYTVKFVFNEVNASFLSELTRFGNYVLPKHYYEQFAWEASTQNLPVGTGPFKLVEYKKGVGVTLEAYEDYFKGKPYLDRIVYQIIADPNTMLQAFLNGEIDVMDTLTLANSEVPSLEKNKNANVALTNGLGIRIYMPINLGAEPWNNLKVRQAIALGLDRDEVVEKALFGIGKRAEGFFIPSYGWAYNDKDIMPERNIEKAKQLLDEAGYKEDENGIRLKASLIYFQGDMFDKTAKVVQANLKELGINIVLDQLEMGSWMQKCVQDKNYDFALIAGSQMPDPSNTEMRFGPKGALQFMNYNNEEVDKLYENARLTVNTTDREKAYIEIQKILSEDLPAMPLADVSFPIVTSSKVHGYYDKESENSYIGYQLVWLEK